MKINIFLILAVLALAACRSSKEVSGIRPSGNVRFAATLQPTVNTVTLSQGVAVTDGVNLVNVTGNSLPPDGGQGLLTFETGPNGGGTLLATSLGDGGTIGAGATIPLDAGGYNFARRIWSNSSGTLCVQHVNDSACVCYKNVAAGSYLTGLFLGVCTADAGTTVTSAVIEQ